MSTVAEHKARKIAEDVVLKGRRPKWMDTTKNRYVAEFYTQQISNGWQMKLMSKGKKERGEETGKFNTQIHT